MSAASVNAEEWKLRNTASLIECRWGCAITPDACRAYQARTVRYVQHFNGDRVPCSRVNAEYVRCFFPEPCPHLLSDEEARAALEARRHRQLPLEGKARQLRARERERLVNPEEMLHEERWRRSLLAG